MQEETDNNHNTRIFTHLSDEEDRKQISMDGEDVDNMINTLDTITFAIAKTQIPTCSRIFSYGLSPLTKMEAVKLQRHFLVFFGIWKVYFCNG